MTVADFAERLRGLPGTMKIRFQVAENGLYKADSGIVDSVESLDGITLVINGTIDNPGRLR